MADHAQLLERVRVFEDSPDLAALLREEGTYAADEAADHIDGLWQLTLALAAALEAADAAAPGPDPLCARCGYPRSNHPFRHPFTARAASQDGAEKT